ncbi:4Fe-4S binding protein [Candidatus Bathyarchaeota archaeon]|jgi:MinD superfamily P-loop ATPase|nr:4Fe-4S binding protein [Candidatus Bathyarchaeota archaeon]MBT4087630.1 4Fe-4S binding protein [Deltaproteobacteria bacterium]MBT4321164.1 4Fe-4S binding protein [Candidatus Bathyarchaeota archaeon]MBT4424539.1 4Fe-4S binding protein [Candidatus Bathyarchaeota archaeon]MBT5641678.1 4Fe-4S binding protein [Candidatus Bathyarchaeota archaeon]
MNQITVLSGKGGTGKTTITACFAALSSNSVFADCDVDASNLHLLLNPRITETIEFKGLKLAEIDPLKCTECGRCVELCKFNAISNFEVDSIHCEGCMVCVVNCPVEAIEFKDRVCGYAYFSETDFGPMAHARLTPGMENSGKLVSLVRQNAKKMAEVNGKDLVLIDGSPGIGCPVIASIANVNAALVVVEPTLSGIHDLKRAIDLLRHFETLPYVVVNKYDINEENTSDIDDFCTEERIVNLGHVPFDSEVTKSMVAGQPIVVFKPDSPAALAIRKIWKRLLAQLES